ncbi:M23 family metallopeptidase [Afipia sp. TerB]
MSGWISAGLGALLGSIVSASAQNIELKLPVACEVGRTCYIQNYVDADPSPSAKDYTCGTLTYDGHSGTDFRVPSRAQSNVEVVAAASGKVLRVRDGVADGAFRESGRDVVRDIECGNGVVIEHADQWETQYCHLAKGSVRVRPGDEVQAGDRLGRIGLSGMTEFPHLHLTVRHRGKTVDPFAYDAAPGCGEGKSLWASSLQPQLAYRERTVLNAGFASRPVTMDLIEAGEIDSERLSAEAPALVAFIRAIGLKAGDVQWLVLKNPAGKTIAENRAPLERDKAQSMLFAGRKKPPNGWDKGTYTATYVVERDEQVVLKRSLELELSD